MYTERGKVIAGGRLKDVKALWRRTGAGWVVDGEDIWREGREEEGWVRPGQIHQRAYGTSEIPGIYEFLIYLTSFIN